MGTPYTNRPNRPPRFNLGNINNNGDLPVPQMPRTPQTPNTAGNRSAYSMRPSRLGMSGGRSATISMRPPTTMSARPTIDDFEPNWPSNLMSKGLEGFVDFTKSGMSFGEKFTYKLYRRMSKWSRKWFTHIFLLLVLVLYSAGGALIFVAVEGRESKIVAMENHDIQKSYFKAVQHLAEDHETRKYSTDEFNGKLVYIMRQYSDAVTTLLNNNKTLEQIEKEANPWTFWNSMFFCSTVYTTIGYGHIAPQTTLGRSLSIVYAIIGIPIFLIVLTDFGKLFTRGLKFVWSYVRRLYYTGTCHQIRNQQHVQNAMSGINNVYNIALRRPSQFFGMNPEAEMEQGCADPEQGNTLAMPPTPTTPGTFEVDDEFNLPISVASALLLSYIFLGAFIYTFWEDWSYFEAFYFVFVSMSTIGFGDFVPQHPIFMLCSIIYLIFGLSLTSMFINVVQIKLSDSFKVASLKLSNTMGMDEATIADENEGDPKTPELASVHSAQSIDAMRKKVKQETQATIAEVEPQRLNTTEIQEQSPPPLPKRTPPTQDTQDKDEKKPKKKRGFFK